MHVLSIRVIECNQLCVIYNPTLVVLYNKTIMKCYNTDIFRHSFTIGDCLEDSVRLPLSIFPYKIHHQHD